MSIAMHAAAPGRRIVSLAAAAIFLGPFLFWVWAFRLAGEFVVPQATFATGLAVGILLLSVVLIWWKGVAALPLLVIGPIVSISWGAFTPRHFTSSPQKEKHKPSLMVNSQLDGVEVWCNGILLGETPLKMTLAEFDEKVVPVQQPPDQPDATTDADQQQPPRFCLMDWSLIPGDPHGKRSHDFPHSESNPLVMRWLSDQKYWWSFRRNGYSVRMRFLRFSQSNDDVYTTPDGSWQTLERHAALLKTLAEHENTDPLTAWPDHIQKWSPPLKQFLEYRPQEASDQPRPIFFRETFSETPLNFTEAVYRKDWRWIARSNDPRSVPLLKLYLQQAEDEYHGQVLTFRRDVVATLMESDLPEIQSLLKDQALATANWPELDVVRLFVDRQLQRGVSRQEIADWLVQLDMHGADWQLVPLLLHVGGDNFAKTARYASFDKWENELNSRRTKDVQAGVLNWLISEWHEAPHADLLMMLTRISSPEVIEALKLTDLGTTDQALALTSILNRSGPGKAERAALSEAAAVALAKATDPQHVSALADVLRHLRTQNGLDALLAYDGPKNRDIDRAVSEVQSVVEGERRRLEADLKLARELISGASNPDDLVKKQSFVWKDDRYEAAEGE
ncbi:MAG: hypothetical protein R3C49_22295 [Planctomycetaceae bacterium]